MQYGVSVWPPAQLSIGCVQLASCDDVGARQSPRRNSARWDAEPVGPDGSRRVTERAVAACRLHQSLPFVHGQAVGEAIRDVERCRSVNRTPFRGLPIEIAFAEVALAPADARQSAGHEHDEQAKARARSI